MTNLQISIVIPVYQGEFFLEPLLQEVADMAAVFDQGNCKIEIAECICVDDGAIDNSATVLARLQTKYNWLRVITLSRNFGQHPATVAGILNSSGDWVVTLDEDLQHRPREILRMLFVASGAGHDVVYGKAQNGPHQSAYRDFASKLAKGCVSRLTGNKTINSFNSFRLIRGDIARAAACSCSKETYFDITLTWYTSRFTTTAIDMIDVRYAATKASGYSLTTLIRHAGRLIVTSDARVLRIGFTIGIAGLLSGLATALAILATKIWFPSHIPIQGWASTVLLLILIGSLLSMQAGLALKFLSLILQRSNGTPTFFVVDRQSDCTVHAALQKIIEATNGAT